MKKTHKTCKLVIFGTGEIGQLARLYFEQDSPYQVVGFVADDQFVTKKTFNKLPLIPISKIKKAFPTKTHEVHVALSYRKLNRIRAAKYKALKNLGYTLASYISSKSALWSDLNYGDNCFILENQTIQPNVKIGNNVMIWSGNHLGHSSIIKNHVYISSHVVISGHCVIGQRSFLGVNSALKDRVKLGTETFVTMGANVARSTQDGDVVLPGKGVVLAGGSQKAEKIKQKYFLFK